MKLDADMYEESFGDYLTAVLNAKLGWVPFNNKLQRADRPYPEYPYADESVIDYG